MYQNIYYQREKNLIHLWDDQRGYSSFPYTRYAYEKVQRGEYKSIYGDSLTKVYKFKKDDPDLFESEKVDQGFISVCQFCFYFSLILILCHTIIQFQLIH